jgi:uncharacterized RDD family membrane protein YckC
VTEPIEVVTLAAGEVAYAPWWRRVVALVLDGFIVSVPMSVIVFGILGFELLPPKGANGITMTNGIRPGILIVEAAQMAYYTFLNGSFRGQTIGKQLLRIRVRDEEEDAPIGYRRAFLRHAVIAAVSIVCWIAQLVDGLWPLRDRRKQALHDKIARSIVVMAD